MYKTEERLIEKCKTLRREGLTLGEIIRDTNLPKTTVYAYIYNISLPPEIKKKIKKENTKRITAFNK